jgi:hypothetical protein
MEFSFFKKILEGQKKKMIASYTFFYTSFFLKKNKEGKSWAQKLVFIILEKHMEKLIIFYYISISFDSVLEIVFARLHSRKMVNNVVENAK